MATAVSPPRQVGTLTPPSSSHGGRGSWDFAVPLHDEVRGIQSEPNAAIADDRTFAPDDVSSQPYSYPSRQPLATQANGNVRPPAQRKQEPVDAQRPTKSPVPDSGHLLNNRVNALQKKPGDIATFPSEADSLLDLYKSSNDSRANVGYNIGSIEAVTSGAEKRKMSLPNPEDDDDNWIHRDKLAQIESRELEEAGFRVRRTSKSGSITTNGDLSYAAREEKRLRMVSPIPADDGDDEHLDYDHHAEMGADRGKDSLSSRQPAVRSRIPIAKASPMPVAQKHVGRDAPLTRSRNGSVSLPQPQVDGIAAIKQTRGRSASVSSQAVHDDSEDAGTYTPRQAETSSQKSEPSPKSSPAKGSPSKTKPRGSPPKSKTPNKTNPTSGGRKGTTGGTRARNTSRQRDTSARRPGTSSGTHRPQTSHKRPEGEAPWIATMFKPDPRLPPDQQMLPTHAKRLAQQQWEREGKVGSIYDREFKLLHEDEFPRPEAKTKDPDQLKDKSDDETKDEQQREPKRDESGSPKWPLGSPKPDSPKSGQEHGGYSTIPKVSGPPLQSPRSPRNTTPRPIHTSPRPEDTIRLPDPPEKKEPKKKKLCCCIVM